MFKKIFLVGILIYFLSFSFVNYVFAQCTEAADCPEYCGFQCELNDPDIPGDDTGYWPPEGRFCLCNPWEAATLEDLIANVTQFIFWVATVIFPLLVLVGAFYFMTSAGSPDKINTGKKIIIYGAAGYGIILFANAIVYLIKNALGQG